ncbi:MAG: fimbrillin family protein [Rikenellaceae bacterium]
MKKLLFTLSAVALMFASCDKSEEGSALATDGVVTFTSDLSTRVETTDKVSKWEYNDQVGIYMLYSSTTSITSENVPYVTGIEQSAEAAENTIFSAVTTADAIIYPNSGTVGFYAYYPYTAALTADCITLDVADQTAEGAMGDLDFMTASATGKSRGDEVKLAFAHKMAKLSFTITANDNVTSLTGLAVTVSGHNTLGVYDVKTGALSGSLSDSDDIEMYVVVSDDTATAEAIIHPETTISGITFSLDGREFGAKLSTENTIYAANSIYSYTIAVGNDYAKFTGDCTIIDWTDGTTAGDPVTEEIIVND